MTPPYKTDPLDTLSYMPAPLGELRVLNLGAGYSNSPVSIKLVNAPFKSITNVELHSPAVAALYALPWKAQDFFVRRQDVFMFMTGVLKDEYDLTLFIDVLEHFPMDQARHLLHRAIDISTKGVLIWIPLGDCPQDTYDNNPLQKHWSTWIENDFLEASVRENADLKIWTFPAFHNHLAHPVDAAWVYFCRKGLPD